MIDYGRVRSQTIPPTLEMTNDLIFVSSNVQPYSEEIDDGIFRNGYEYNYVGYTKNEYIALQENKINTLNSDLLLTQEALVDLYESLKTGVIIDGGDA